VSGREGGSVFVSVGGWGWGGWLSGGRRGGGGGVDGSSGVFDWRGGRGASRECGWMVEEVREIGGLRLQVLRKHHAL
jgi:hypothetical protein